MKKNRNKEIALPAEIFASFGFDAIILFISIGVFGAYLWIAGSNGVPLIVDVGPEHHEQIRSPNLFPDASPHHYGFHNLLADSFEVGRLDLLIDPPQELIDLPNPRDPQANERTRILDISYYNKKFYMYFGPVPALTLFLPFRWLGIGKISEPLAVVFYSFALYLTSLYILLTCIKRFIPYTRKYLIVLSTIALAFSNGIPYILRHPVVYEVSIVSGIFFTMLGLALFLRAWHEQRFRNGMLVCSGAVFGLSIGCRPSYFFIVFFILFVFIITILYYKISFKQIIIYSIAIFTPMGISIALLMAYNYLRFGAPTDFGMPYMLGPTEWDYKSTMYRIANLWPSLYLNLICPQEVNNVFPFLHLRPIYPFKLPTGYYIGEPIGSIFTSAPITLLSLLAPFVIIKKNLRNYFGIPILLVLFGFFFLLLGSWIMFGSTMRYQVDFLPTILLGSIIGSIYWESNIKSSLKKLIIATGISVLLCIGIVSHLAFGMTGMLDTLRRGEPRQYFALENFFRPVSALLTPFFGSDQTKILDITTPNGSARFEDGTEGPWLGEEGLHVRFTAAQSIKMQFSADVVASPDLPDGVNLEFQNPAGSSKSSFVKGISHQTFQFTLQPGSNRISIFATPNRPLLKGQDNLRLAVLKNIQIAPVGKN
jgi:hypothetical protein